MLVMSEGLAPEQEKAAFEILAKLCEHPESVDFQEPVDYPEVIKQPMDLGTIREKLEAEEYESIYEFIEDLQLVWTNCKTYNRSGSKIVQRAKKLERITQKWFEQLDNPGQEESSSESEEEEESEEESEEITFEEQVDLAEKIRRLDSNVMADVIHTVKKAHPEAIEDFGKDKVKVRIDGLAKEVFVAIWDIVENDMEERRKREMAQKLKELAEIILE